ncbi:MAG: hypothetical protein MMC33_003485 [Icmadophila ericetorum]|nr:hypothetical protein [Icmadophila ericetorum]
MSYPPRRFENFGRGGPNKGIVGEDFRDHLRPPYPHAAPPEESVFHSTVSKGHEPVHLHHPGTHTPHTPCYPRPTPSHISSRNGKAPEGPELEYRRDPSAAPQPHEWARQAGPRRSSIRGPKSSQMPDYPFPTQPPIQPLIQSTIPHEPPKPVHSRRSEPTFERGMPQYPPVYEPTEYTEHIRSSRRRSEVSDTFPTSQLRSQVRESVGSSRRHSKLKRSVSPWDSISQAPTYVEPENVTPPKSMAKPPKSIIKRSSVAGGKPKLAFVKSKGEKGRYPGLRLGFAIDIGLEGKKKAK